MRQIALLLLLSALIAIPARADEEDKAVYTVTVLDNTDTKLVLQKATIRAGGGLFGGSGGKKELEVRKDGGKMKIKVPFNKIAKITVLEVKPDYVQIKLETPDGKSLEGHVATNIEVHGETDFGEAQVRIRDAKSLEFSSKG